MFNFVNNFSHFPGKGGRSRKPLALDLFIGTGSVGHRLSELGFQVVSLDIRSQNNPTFCTNILTWKYWEAFQPGDFTVIGASPLVLNIRRPKPSVSGTWRELTSWSKRHLKSFLSSTQNTGGSRTHVQVCSKNGRWSETSHFWMSIIANFAIGGTKNPRDFGHVK